MTRIARAALIFAVAMAATPAPARAHRLDEYLQATRIGLDTDRITVEIDLTPGADVAPAVLSAIDADADGRIDPNEAAVYATRVGADVGLKVDGRTVPLAFSVRLFPAVDEMRAGTGLIRLLAVGDVPTGTGRHRLEYANHHMPGVSAYLVNAWFPPAPTIAAGTPARDYRQRTLTLDYRVRTAFGPLFWSITAAGALGGLLVTRWRSTGRQAGKRSRTAHGWA